LMYKENHVLIGSWQFPFHWKVTKEDKPHFTKVPTLLHFEIDPERYIWTSRRHRKGRKLLVPKDRRKPKKFRFWGYQNSLSYWGDLLFFIGFAWLVVAQICKLILCTHEGFETCDGTAQLNTVQIFLFIGNSIFLVAGYLGYLEVINQHVKPNKYHYSNEQRRRRLLGWRPKEISFWASIILIIGVMLFILHITMDQINLFRNSHVANSVGSWMPAVMAAACFAMSQYLLLVEQCHSWFRIWKPTSLAFWLLVLRFVASLTFLVAGICGLWYNDSVRLWGSKVMYLIGSVLFLISFYAGILEVLN